MNRIDNNTLIDFTPNPEDIIDILWPFTNDEIDRLHQPLNLSGVNRNGQQNPQITPGVFRRSIVQLLCILDRALSFSLRRFLLKHLRRLIQKIDGRYISSKPIDGRGVRDFQAKYY